MYTFSEKFKKDLVKQCFKEVCEHAQKEETGALKGIVNTVFKADIFLDIENSVVVVEKDAKVSTNYNYKFNNTKRRIRIIQKIDKPYYFMVELNGEKLPLECDQYSFDYLD